MTAQYISVTGIRTARSGIHWDVFVHGDDSPLTMDLIADELKRRAGTYEPSDLEAYLEGRGLELVTYPNREPGSYHARIGSDVCIREPGSSHALLTASADGSTPTEARRNLEAKVSGQTLVENPMLPIRRQHRVPILSGARQPAEQPESGGNSP